MVCCEQLGLSNPFSQGVGCLHTTCQRLFSTRQQVVGKPNLLTGSRPLLLQRGPPWSSWRLPALLSVFPCVKSPVRWRGKPRIAHHSSFSTTVKSPPLVLHRMVGTLSMMAQGQMQSSAWSCKEGGGIISYFPSMAVWKYSKERWASGEPSCSMCFLDLFQHMEPDRVHVTTESTFLRVTLWLTILIIGMWYSFQMSYVLFEVGSWPLNCIFNIKTVHIANIDIEWHNWLKKAYHLMSLKEESCTSKCCFLSHSVDYKVETEAVLASHHPEFGQEWPLGSLISH